MKLSIAIIPTFVFACGTNFPVDSDAGDASTDVELPPQNDAGCDETCDAREEVWLK